MQRYAEGLRERSELRVVSREVDPRDEFAAVVRLSQREPDTRLPNLSSSRAMMVSDTELRICLATPHDLTRYQAKAESRGEALGVAILLGAPPKVFLGACEPAPCEVDEMAIANFIRGGSMSMRPCPASST